MVGACYAGAPEDGTIVRPLKSSAPDRRSARAPYVAMQSMFDPLVPHGWHRYWKSSSCRRSPTGRSTRSSTTPRGSRRHARHHHPPARRDARSRGRRTQPPSASATPRTTSSSTPSGPRPAKGDRHTAWARDFFDAMRPHAGGRVCVNFLGEEGSDRVRQAYGARNYERLVELKRAYDQTNFFQAQPEHPARLTPPPGRPADLGAPRVVVCFENRQRSVSTTRFRRRLPGAGRRSTGARRPRRVRPGPAQPGGQVPVALAQEFHRCRHKDGADDRGVDQQRDRDAEAHLHLLERRSCPPSQSPRRRR